VKASTAKEYRRNLERFILPALGQRDGHGYHPGRTWRSSTTTSATSPIRRTAASKWSRRCSASPRCGACVRTAPTRESTSGSTQRRSASASSAQAELRRIGEVLREMEAEGIELPSAILAARLLILTGCRLNRDHDVEVGLRGSGRSACPAPAGLQVRRQSRPSRPARCRAAPATPSAFDGNPWVITGTLTGQAAERSPALLAVASAPAPASRTSASTTCATPSRPRPSRRVRVCR
jgi:hypothetical protein